MWTPRRPIGALDCCGRDDVRGLARGSFGKYAQISVVKVLASQATTSQARLCLVRQAELFRTPITDDTIRKPLQSLGTYSRPLRACESEALTMRDD